MQWYCELVSSPAQMPAILDIAIRTAIEQNDVAVLVIPGDILLSQMERRRSPQYARRTP